MIIINHTVDFCTQLAQGIGHCKTCEKRVVIALYHPHRPQLEIIGDLKDLFLKDGWSVGSSDFCGGCLA